MRRFVRVRQGKMVLGVANGLGYYFRIDPLLIRVFLVALSLLLAGGLAVVLLYFIVGWTAPIVDTPPAAE